MTKQEQIEQMNTIMQEAHKNYCEHNSCVNCPYFDKKPDSIYCENYLEATALYNAGYKQEKEVVKEILQDFSYILELIKNNDDAKVILNHIKKRKNEYGIELE